MYSISPASVSKFISGNLVSDKYYSPDYSKDNYSLSDGADNLIQMLKSSLSELENTEGRFALMQSGGLDTRLILACLPNIAVDITITYEKTEK